MMRPLLSRKGAPAPGLPYGLYLKQHETKQTNAKFAEKRISLLLIAPLFFDFKLKQNIIQWHDILQARNSKAQRILCSCSRCTRVTCRWRSFSASFLLRFSSA
jgi:hypothetical protein